MAIAARIMASGMSAQAATNIVGDFATVVPAGTGQTDATLLNSTVNYSPVTGSSTGVRLPSTLSPGDVIVVYNGSASNALLVYPPTGGAINGGTLNAGFSVAANTRNTFQCFSATVFAK